jgi:hypothetical protein
MMPAGSSWPSWGTPHALAVYLAGTVPRGPCIDPPVAALTTTKSPARIGDCDRLRQRVNVHVRLVPAGFARRCNEADAVRAHVRERHGRARASAISGHTLTVAGQSEHSKNRLPRLKA